MWGLVTFTSHNNIISYHVEAHMILYEWSIMLSRHGSDAHQEFVGSKVDRLLCIKKQSG